MASNPDSTGGAGVTLERRLVVYYLVQLLLGGNGVGLDGIAINSVTVQAPFPVDDIAVAGERRSDGSDFKLFIAARRRPTFVPSNESDLKLFKQLLDGLDSIKAGDINAKVAVAVSGAGQAAAEQVAFLCSKAREHTSITDFEAVVSTFNSKRRNRLKMLKKLATACRPGLSSPKLDEMVFELLQHLEIIQLRLEGADTTDWTALDEPLNSWVRQGVEPRQVINQLVTAVQMAESAGSTFTLASVRSELTGLLGDDAHRFSSSWKLLNELGAEARSGVRTEIGLPASPLVIDRRETIDKFLGVAEHSKVVVITGDSGSGKSGMLLDAVATGRTPVDSDIAVWLDVRLLPRSLADLRQFLGCSLAELFADADPEESLLVLDSSERILDGPEVASVLGALARSAVEAGWRCWISTTPVGAGPVHSAVEQFATAGRFEMPGLTDAELIQLFHAEPSLAATFGAQDLSPLLRMPGVIDLIVRVGAAGPLATESAILDSVWRGLVEQEKPGQGSTGYSRAAVLRELASQRISAPSDFHVSPDDGAVSDLVARGILRSSAHPWVTLPVFSHDLLEHYALAMRLLDSRRIFEQLEDAAQPRRLYPAARLAVQTLLVSSDTIEYPINGRLRELNDQADAFASEDGRSDRWRDLPYESLLPLPDCGDRLDQEGLLDSEKDRILRVFLQHSTERGLVQPSPGARNLIQRLIASGMDLSHQNFRRALLTWLRLLLLLRVEVGEASRVALGRRLVQHIAGEYGVDPRAATQSDSPDLRELIANSPRAIDRRSNGHDDSIDDLLELVALLGPDLNREGRNVLEGIASIDPERMKSVLERPLTPHGLCQYSPELAAHLAVEYYIDDRDWYGYHRDGVRRHRLSGSLADARARPDKGPFMALARADFALACQTINKILNHAAAIRTTGSPLAVSDAEQHSQAGYPFGVSDDRPFCYGDDDVWAWYRGATVGPTPCMSALAALEQVSDDLLRSDRMDLDAIAAAMADGCRNLAMPGLLFGIAVRHSEKDQRGVVLHLLAEPATWILDVRRLAREDSGFSSISAPQTPVHNAERYRWPTNAIAVDASRKHSTSDDLALQVRTALIDRTAPEQRNKARIWASWMDPANISLVVDDQQNPIGIKNVYIEQAAEPFEPSFEQQLMSISIKYDRYSRDRSLPDTSTLLNQISLVNDALHRSLSLDPFGSVPTASSLSAAIIAHEHDDPGSVDADAITWAVSIASDLAFSVTEFLPERGIPDRTGPAASLSRALPLLIFSKDQTHPFAGFLTNDSLEQFNAAAAVIAACDAPSVQLEFASELDRVWAEQCDADLATCRHRRAYAWTQVVLQHSVTGTPLTELSDGEFIQRGGKENRRDPFGVSGLGEDEDRQQFQSVIIAEHVSAAIRAVEGAPTTLSCLAGDAAALQKVALNAQSLALLAVKYPRASEDFHVAARTVIRQMAKGPDFSLTDYLKRFEGEGRHLAGFLEALSRMAAEVPIHGEILASVWPDVVVTFAGSTYRDDRSMALSALLPRPTGLVPHECRLCDPEIDLVNWTRGVDWTEAIDSWIALEGDVYHRCVYLFAFSEDHIQDLGAARFLGWLRILAEQDADAVAGLATEWLRSIKHHVDDNSRADWTTILDLLAAAGDISVGTLLD